MFCVFYYNKEKADRKVTDGKNQRQKIIISSLLGSCDIRSYKKYLVIQITHYILPKVYLVFIQFLKTLQS